MKAFNFLPVVILILKNLSPELRTAIRSTLDSYAERAKTTKTIYDDIGVEILRAILTD